MEMTPFEFYTKKRDVKKYLNKEGYISINYTTVQLDNNNFSATWIFRNENKRSVFAFTTINKGITEVLNEIGISSY
jgi:hypothetical protein